MKRIDTRTVELTDDEMRAHDLLDEYLSDGQGIPFAAKLALNRTEAERIVRFSLAFVEYLSDGTCLRRGDRIHVKPEWQD